MEVWMIVAGDQVDQAIGSLARYRIAQRGKELPGFAESRLFWNHRPFVGERLGQFAYLPGPAFIFRESHKGAAFRKPGRLLSPFLGLEIAGEEETSALKAKKSGSLAAGQGG